MEYFDVLTPDGGRTGQVKERSAVHRDGDWHGTAHIWLVRRQNGRLQVLLQKRSRKKETFPGCFDTSCAGHLSAGDSFEEGALRELSEELGIRAQASDLFSVGLYSYEVKESFGGTDIIDREIAAVYLYQKPVAFPADAVGPFSADAVGIPSADAVGASSADAAAAPLSGGQVLRLQKEEVESVCWMDFEELKARSEAGDPDFCIFAWEIGALEDGFRMAGLTGRD